MNRFVPVNCPTITDTLAESQLFGHRKGAFSGAERDHDGYFKAADGGTLFLNEIGDLSAAVQSKLLDATESKTIVRLGDSRETSVDVRLLAAANHDLQTLVGTRHFRRDLFHRVHSFELKLPPLRERLDDLPLLVQHFLKEAKFADYDPRQATLIVGECGLAHYHWPGNVRELAGVLNHAVKFTRSRLFAELIGRLKVTMDGLTAMESPEVERAMLVTALKRCGGNKKRAAAHLRMALSTFRDRLQKHGIDI
jgi:transcriptional regulator with GAF, ATPase, and Fis domain